MNIQYLNFKTGVYLDLKETYVVLSFRWNLISIFKLGKFGYCSSFENSKFSISLNSNVTCTGSLSMYDNLCWIMLSHLMNPCIQVHVIKKRKLTDKDSVMLWYKQLGHIFKQRIQRLVSDGILHALNMTNFQICIECIKGKQIDKGKLGANRSTNILELIHSDIYGPFPTTSWNGQRYFITFIDDYPRYGYLYLIHEKSQALDVFKTFKVEVELQFGKKIKIVKSNGGGEYYGRYDGLG